MTVKRQLICAVSLRECNRNTDSMKSIVRIGAEDSVLCGAQL